MEKSIMERYQSMIPETNVVYGTSQLQGAKTTANESETIRLVFKADGDSITDIKNSTLNFRLLLTQPTNTQTALSVNNSTVASLFQVQSVNCSGAQMNFQIGDMKDQMVRRILRKLNNMVGQSTSGVDYKEELYVPMSNDTTATTTNPWLGMPNSFDPNLMTADIEAQRRRQNTLRHFTIATGACTLIATASPGVASQYYAVKFAELVPELESLSDSDCALMLQYGLEINMRLLPSQFCMSYTPNNKTAGTAAALGTLTTYQLDNIYVGTVIKNFGKVPRPISGEVGFRTFHYVKTAIQPTSYTSQFSLPASCYVDGIMITFSLTNGANYGVIAGYTAANGDLSLVRNGMVANGARASHNVLQSVNPSLSAEYCYPLEINNTQIQITQDVYPKAMAPGQRSLQRLQTVASYSEQIFGKSYGVSYEDFNTFSFVQFIPVKRFVKQSELFQVYQDYTLNADTPQLMANIIVSCRRVLSIDKGQVVLQ